MEEKLARVLEIVEEKKALDKELAEIFGEVEEAEESAGGGDMRRKSGNARDVASPDTGAIIVQMSERQRKKGESFFPVSNSEM